MRRPYPIARWTVLGLTLVALVLPWLGCGTGPQGVPAPGRAPQAVTALQGLSQAAPEVQRVMATQIRHTDRLMALPGVVGTATGLAPDGRLAIKVFTKAPGVAGIPESLDGVPVVVEVTGDFTAFALKRRYRPVPIGVSVGNNNECAAGTIGAVVKIGNTKYMLSNNHVLARENQASTGEPIVQPGRYDNRPICANRVGQDKVAELSQFEPLRFDGSDNRIDAAIAIYTTTNITCATLPGFYGYPSSTTVPATIGLAIKKVGRTTELTTGTVTAINATVNVGYSSGVARFVGQIVTSSSFSRSGDSGSVVVTNNSSNNPVGLLFAGSNNGTTILNPINDVLSRFNATICSSDAL